jgi:hypothetical protein
MLEGNKLPPPELLSLDGHPLLLPISIQLNEEMGTLKELNPGETSDASQAVLLRFRNKYDAANAILQFSSHAKGGIRDTKPGGAAATREYRDPNAQGDVLTCGFPECVDPDSHINR